MHCQIQNIENEKLLIISKSELVLLDAKLAQNISVFFLSYHARDFCLTFEIFLAL